MKETNDVKKAKLIEEAIRLAWGSLESHLRYTHEKPHTTQGDELFHQECVREYSRIIYNLSQLYGEPSGKKSNKS